MSKDKNEPMDTTTPERLVGIPQANRTRNAYALVELVAEVRDLFPETPYEFSNYDGRNTALDVAFDTSVMLNDDAILLHRLLGLVKDDPRVLDVISEDGQVLVALRPSSRTQDSREPFNLADAYMVMTDV